MSQRAIFLDRDGTLVYPSHYPSRPEQLRLYEDIGPGLRALQDTGFRMVVITNQTGIARGYFTESQLERMHVHLAEQLARLGIRLDAIYHCSHHPDGIVPSLAVRCHCRKPEPGMLLQAAADLDLDLEQSWFIGDILDDVEAGNRAGCRTVLVDIGTEHSPTTPVRCPTFAARSTSHALEIIKTVETLAPTLDLIYRPTMWHTVPQPLVHSTTWHRPGSWRPYTENAQRRSGMIRHWQHVEQRGHDVQ